MPSSLAATAAAVLAAGIAVKRPCREGWYESGTGGYCAVHGEMSTAMYLFFSQCIAQDRVGSIQAPMKRFYVSPHLDLLLNLYKLKNGPPAAGWVLFTVPSGNEAVQNRSGGDEPIESAILTIR